MNNSSRFPNEHALKTQGSRKAGSGKILKMTAEELLADPSTLVTISPAPSRQQDQPSLGHQVFPDTRNNLPFNRGGALAPVQRARIQRAFVFAVTADPIDVYNDPLEFRLMVSSFPSENLPAGLVEIGTNEPVGPAFLQRILQSPLMREDDMPMKHGLIERLQSIVTLAGSPSDSDFHFARTCGTTAVHILLIPAYYPEAPQVCSDLDHDHWSMTSTCLAAPSIRRCLPSPPPTGYSPHTSPTRPPSWTPL